jgi:hypothetical protein
VVLAAVLRRLQGVPLPQRALLLAAVEQEAFSAAILKV